MRVLEHPAAVLTVPGPITVDAPDDTGGAVVSFSVSATDANPASPAVTCCPAVGLDVPHRDHHGDLPATDAAGNTGTGSFTVTVRDVTPPVVHVPAPITVDATGSSGEAVVEYVVTATDNDRPQPHTGRDLLHPVGLELRHRDHHGALPGDGPVRQRRDGDLHGEVSRHPAAGADPAGAYHRRRHR